MRNKCQTEPVSYGGQALMEGIMMRGTGIAAMALRLPDGTIEVTKKTYKTPEGSISSFGLAVDSRCGRFYRIDGFRL